MVMKRSSFLFAKPFNPKSKAGTQSPILWGFQGINKDFRSGSNI
jgi:hypothetical protein